MLWALRVLDLLLDLDLEHLPLGLWCLSVLLPWDGLLLLPSPWLFCLTYSKYWNDFYVHIYDISYQMLDILSVGVMCCIYCMLYLSCFLLCNHCLSCIWRFLFHWLSMLSWFHHWTYVCWSPSLSFHALWHVEGVTHMWCLLSSFLTWPIF